MVNEEKLYIHLGSSSHFLRGAVSISWSIKFSDSYCCCILSYNAILLPGSIPTKKQTNKKQTSKQLFSICSAPCIMEYKMMTTCFVKEFLFSCIKKCNLSNTTVINFDCFSKSITNPFPFLFQKWYSLSFENTLFKASGGFPFWSR